MVAGVRVLRTDPVPDPTRPLLLYLHGGGYALGNPEVALPITERLAAGAEIVSIDYRLAPEHPCPTAVEDAGAVYRALVDQERPEDEEDGRRRTTGPRPIVVAGDSAGANLALSVALAARDRGGPTPAGLLLFSPHLGWARPGSGRSTGDRRPSDVDRTAEAWLAEAYRGDLAPDDARLSPLGADLAGLPPILVQVGTSDTGLEHGASLARLARAAGVEVTLDVWAGLWHTWHYHRDLPEADQALAEAVAFVRRLSAEPR